MKDIGIERHQLCGRWLNNRVENSRQPLRRREGAMSTFIAKRSAALAECCELEA